ncbi:MULTISPECIES: GAF and ANTAR domain-containing protein [Mycobacteriaceae]|uniref:GAF and ANTAR domain-containing protein n=1 Tax=Mycobacteriaceae TaxID=1762 RepID=UPI0007FD7E8D|nr:MULTISPECIES: GAF and ANTAR domain-containing protein [Mycobacteriaceae]MCK0177013.1 GAF and ANTAR domain-containing protein [Mycolicibacterium sp. F2034L]OBB57690.1 response regulator receiver protein [Mycobacterium sp. 852013-51886_SCH5428379]
MTIERPGELDRLATTSQAIMSLHDVFAAEEPLDAVLDRVAQAAARAIPDADGVSLTVIDDHAARTAAWTDERSHDLDTAQNDDGAGPCLECATSRQPVRVALEEISSEQERRWPRFVAAARSEAVSATLSVPLLVGPPGSDAELFGSLNVYSFTAGAFDPFDEELMRLYTVTAGAAIANARRWQQSRDTTENLQRALTSRAVIDQAKGALQAVHGCSPDEAFDRLVRRSQESNVKLHTVAEQLLESLRNRD